MKTGTNPIIKEPSTDSNDGCVQLDARTEGSNEYNKYKLGPNESKPTAKKTDEGIERVCKSTSNDLEECQVSTGLELSEDIEQDICFLKEVVINAFLRCNAMKNGATPRSDACGANGEFIEKEDSDIDNSDLREKIIAIKRSRVEEKLRPYMIQAKENSTQIDELQQAPSNDLPKESTELEDMDIDEEQSDDSDVQCLEEETPLVDACGKESQYFLVRSAEKMTSNPGLRQTAKSQKRRRHRIRSRATARGETPHWIVLDPATKFRLKVVKPTVFEPAGRVTVSSIFFFFFHYTQETLLLRIVL